MLRRRRLILVTFSIGATLIGLVWVVWIHRFLALTQPVGQGVLVVEGWIPRAALASVPAVFSAGDYQYLAIVTSARDSADNGLSTDNVARELVRLGCNANKLVRITAPFGTTRRTYEFPVWGNWATLNLTQRTYATALAVRDWLSQLPAPIKSVDILTVGVHSRKSWIFFQHVMGSRYRVGVISAPEPSYDPRYWMLSKRGFLIVNRSLCGYLYAKAWSLAAAEGK